MRLPFLLLLCPSLLLAQLDVPAQGNLHLLAGKVYVAEASGEGTVYSDGRAMSPEQANVFSALGAIIVTKEKAHQAYVFSSGTAMFVDSDTRVEIAKFDQDNFAPGRTDLTIEPSITRSRVHVSYGLVGICTNHLLSGSSMRFSTTLGLIGVNLHARLAIQSLPDRTSVYLLSGDCSVAPVNDTAHSVLLRPGEMATVLRSGGAVQVDQMDGKLLASMEDKGSMSCRVRTTVMFDTTTGEKPELEAFPIVSARPPVGVIVSPDRLE